MSYYQGLDKFGEHVAFIEEDVSVTYVELESLVVAFANQLPESRQLVIICCRNNINTIVAYLACLRGGHVVILTEHTEDSDKFKGLFTAFKPNLIIENGQVKTGVDVNHQLAADCRVLLPTSGSTGSSKQVALSDKNLTANCRSICEYLPIRETDITVTTLPFMYSYGLSVINTHLAVGATVLLNEHSVLSREFWALMKKWPVSSLAGVPYTYEMLLKLRFDRQNWPNLRYMTQAGGRLAESMVKHVADFASQQGFRFFVMYGQTEATARIAYLHPSKACRKPGAIGQAIPGGKISVVDSEGNALYEPAQEGELVYYGDNIMLGYAENLAELRGFEALPYLATGDIGYRDKDGDWYISGRKKRIVKLFGQRINLDDVEQMLNSSQQRVYCCGRDNKLVVAVAGNNDKLAFALAIAKQLGIHHSAIQVITMDTLPITANGKKDYNKVMELANA